MDEFLDIYNLPELKHDEIISLNRSITLKEIEAVIKTFKGGKKAR